MKRGKKNRLFTFIFSFMPGAAEMYMGFMKNGASMMALFFLSFIVPSLLRTSDVFILFAGLIWAFAFFHALNLAACDQEFLQTLEDRCIWEEYGWGKPVHIPDGILRTWGAGCLILLGCVMLWESLTDFVYRAMPEWMLEWLSPLLDQIPQVVIALFIIAVGLRLIRGKKAEIEMIEGYTEDRNDG